MLFTYVLECFFRCFMVMMNFLLHVCQRKRLKRYHLYPKSLFFPIFLWWRQHGRTYTVSISFLAFPYICCYCFKMLLLVIITASFRIFKDCKHCSTNVCDQNYWQLDKQTSLSIFMFITEQLCFGTIDWSGWTEERSSQIVYTWDGTVSKEVGMHVRLNKCCILSLLVFLSLSFTKFISFDDLLCST